MHRNHVDLHKIPCFNCGKPAGWGPLLQSIQHFKVFSNIKLFLIDKIYMQVHPKITTCITKSLRGKGVKSDFILIDFYDLTYFIIDFYQFDLTVIKDQIC